MAFLKLSLAAARRLSQPPSVPNGQWLGRNDRFWTVARRPAGTANGPDKQHRNSSLAAAAATDTAGTGVVAGKPKWDPLDVSFADPVATFKSKTTWEILRAYVVYQLCSSSYIVENNIQVR